MSGLDPLFASLRSVRAWDVLLPGFIDRDGRHPRFTPLADSAYVVLEEGFLRLDSVGNHGQLALRLVSEVDIPKFLADEDEEFSLGSVGHLFFADAHPSFRITRIRCATNGESDLANLTVRCAEFEFENAWPIFADPGWHFGVRLGASGAYERWIADHRESEPSLQEFSWTP
jgi:hypothetical protein